MEESGQLHAPAALLPRKEPLVRIVHTISTVWIINILLITFVFFLSSSFYDYLLFLMRMGAEENICI